MKLRSVRKWDHTINEEANVLQVWNDKDEMWEDVPIVEEVEDDRDGKAYFNQELGNEFLDTEYSWKEEL